jgi:hypothetical protein
MNREESEMAGFVKTVLNRIFELLKRQLSNNTLNIVDRKLVACLLTYLFTELSPS